MLDVCFLEEAEEKAAVTTPQSALHSLQRSRREIRFSTKLPQCFLLNLDIFVFFVPSTFLFASGFFLLNPSPIIELPCLVSSSLMFLRLFEIVVIVVIVAEIKRCVTHLMTD